MYKLCKKDNELKKGIIRLIDNASIPFDPANMDFVEYQKWLSEGNTPLPADE
jgi:hypothetical protein